MNFVRLVQTTHSPQLFCDYNFSISTSVHKIQKISFIRSDRKSTCATNTANNLFKLNSLEEFNWWSNINLSFLFTNGGPWLINVAWRSISSWKNGSQNFKKQLELFAIKYYTRMWLNLLFWIFIRLFKCQPRWEIILFCLLKGYNLTLKLFF